MAVLRSQAVSARNGRVGRLDGRQAGNAALAARAQGAEEEVARVRARFAKVEYWLDRFRAQKFGERVMQETADLLMERPPLMPTEILPELRTVTLGGAPHEEFLTPGTLKKKMDARVSFGRCFEPCDEGRYARRAG